MACEHRNPADDFLYGNSSKKCKICRHKVYKQNYARNKEKILARCAEYRKDNPEKIKAIKEKYKISLLGKKDSAIQLLPKRYMAYVVALKTLIINISEIEREYNQFNAAQRGGA